MSDNPDHGVWSSDDVPSSWVWVDFAGFWHDFTSSQKKLPQQAYSQSGRFPVVDQGHELIGGYSDAEHLISDAAPPVIVFGDHTRACKFIETPFIQGADGVRVLKSAAVADPRYAFYALKTLALPDKGYSRHFKFLKASQFPLAPAQEQRRIVAKLDSLRARSARARQELNHIPKLIERYKQAILAKAFSGELTATPFGDAVALSTCIKALDQGWSPKCEPFSRTSNEKWAVLKTTAVQSIHFDEHENKQLPPHLDPRPTIAVLPGDVLITRAGPRSRVGIACVVKRCGPRLMLADKIYRLKVDARRTNPVWLALMLNSPQALAKIEEMKTGISDSGLNLTQGKFLDLRLPNADLNAQNAVVRLVEHAFAWLDKIATEHARAEHLLPKLDQAILAKAFRGELVPQDPNDEPASALLERIKSERKGEDQPRRRRARSA